MDQKSTLNLGLIIAVSFFLAIFVTLPQVANAVTQEWVKRYDGPGKREDGACAIAVDTNGNVYVTGTSEGADYSDYATIKYNSDGVRQWGRRYNGPGNLQDWARGMAVDTNGNVYVTGTSEGTNYNADYATIKYDSAGVKQWVRRYNGPGKADDFATAIAVDTNGNVYVTGGITNAADNLDFGTIKYSSAGVRQWGRRYDGPGKGGDWPTSIVVDTDGNVYVTGYSENTAGNEDYATIKYNSAGVRQWVRRYNGPGKADDFATAIAVDTNGNVYVTGGITNTADNLDFGTIKYNSAGVRQWVRRYDGPGKGNDRADAIALDNNGDVYITGVCKNATRDEDYATIKYSSAGVRQWVRRYDGTYATDIAVDTGGNVYVTGFSSNVKDNMDFATIMYSSDGVRQWVMRYDGPGKWMDHARAIAVDTNGNVYVTGSIYNAAFNSDYATIKYAP